MKKNFKLYAIAWAILLAVYNAIVFSVQALPRFEITYDARFWLSWALILVAFVGQLFCAYIAFKAENKEKLFLNIPLITVSYAGAVAMTVVGSACMLIPNCPYWIAAVVCLLVFAISAIGVIKAKAAAEIVSEVGQKVKVQTFFIKALTVDADILMARAKNDEIKAECKKVYEAVRYSDPMSNDALSSAESQITIAFAEFKAAVEKDDTDLVKSCADKVLILLKDRNNKCKLLK